MLLLFKALWCMDDLLAPKFKYLATQKARKSN